jgi:hypothetical protein
MKKISLILLSVALVFSLAFTACEDFTIVPPVEPVAYDFGSGPYEYDLSKLNKAACTPAAYDNNAFGAVPDISYDTTGKRLTILMTSFFKGGGNWRATACIPVPEELLLGVLDATGTVTVTINGTAVAPPGYRICLGTPHTSNSWNKTGWITIGTAYTLTSGDLSNFRAVLAADNTIWFIIQINGPGDADANKPLSAYFTISSIVFDAS